MNARTTASYSELRGAGRLTHDRLGGSETDAETDSETDSDADPTTAIA